VFVVELINVDANGTATTNTPFIWNAFDDEFYFKENSKIFEKIKKRFGIRVQELDGEFRKRTQLIYALYKKKIFGFEEVQKIISEYYKRPQEVLKRFGITD
jgi:hypothetical protein